MVERLELNPKQEGVAERQGDMTGQKNQAYIEGNWGRYKQKNKASSPTEDRDLTGKFPWRRVLRCLRFQDFLE